MGMAKRVPDAEYWCLEKLTKDVQAAAWPQVDVPRGGLQTSACFRTWTIQ